MKTTMILFCVISVGLTQVAAFEPNEGIVVSDKVRVRASASTNAKIVTQVNAGAVLPIISRGDYGEKLIADLPSSYWYEVETDKGRGFIWGGFFWPISNQITVNKDIGNLSLDIDKKSYALRPVVWADSPYQSNERLEYDDHELVSLFSSSGEMWFIKVPKKFQTSANKLAVSSDGYLLMSSGIRSYDRLADMLLVGDELYLEVEQQTYSNQSYSIKVKAKLVSTKNFIPGYFEVFSIELTSDL